MLRGETGKDETFSPLEVDRVIAGLYILISRHLVLYGCALLGLSSISVLTQPGLKTLHS